MKKAMASFHCIMLSDRKNPSLHVCTLCIGIFLFKMTTEIICLQDELLIVLITTLDLETFIKGHHAYKDIWTPKQGEQLDVLVEPDNWMDKFAVYVKINEKNCGAFKERYISKVCKDNLLLTAQWCILEGLGKSYW